jgi:hypothetical protein
MLPSVTGDGEDHRPVKINFDHLTGSLHLEISKVDFGYFDHPVMYAGRIFQPKEEIHIMVLSSNAADALRQHLEQKPADLPVIREMINEAGWQYRKLSQLFHITESPDVETIIQMVDLPLVSSVFQQLSRVIGRGLILPLTHVTLYTLGTETGIPLPDQQVFDRLVQAEIQPGDLRSAFPGEEQGSI